VKTAPLPWQAWALLAAAFAALTAIFAKIGVASIG
jgi:transporter family protein